MLVKFKLVKYLHDHKGKSYRVKEAPVVSQESKKQRKSNEPSTAGAAS